MENQPTEFESEKDNNEADRAAIQAHLKTKYGKDPEGNWAAAVGPALTGAAIEETVYYAQDSERPHWDVVSYGLNALGYEFVLRLPRGEGDQAPSQWPVRLFEQLGQMAMEDDVQFNLLDYVETGALDADEDNKFVGVLLAPDPFLGQASTPSGDLFFVELVPLLEDEMNKVKGWAETIEDEETFNAYRANVEALLAEIAKTETKLFITDLKRGV